MNWEQLEKDIVGVLKIPGADVKILPHVAALNEPRKTAKPILYVILNVGDFEDPENLAIISQLERIKGEIFMRAQKRHGPLGIFDLYDKVTALLLGYRIPGTKHAITFDQFGYVAGIQNNWQYALTFSFSAYRVEGDPAGPDKLIRKVTFETEEK